MQLQPHVIAWLYAIRFLPMKKHFMVHHTLHQTVTQLDYCKCNKSIAIHKNVNRWENVIILILWRDKEKVDLRLGNNAKNELLYFQDDFLMQHPSTTRNIAHWSMDLYFWCYELELVILKLWTPKLVTFELQCSLGWAE